MQDGKQNISLLRPGIGDEKNLFLKHPNGMSIQNWVYLQTENWTERNEQIQGQQKPTSIVELLAHNKQYCF